ncbi:hypothetical protein ACUY3N_04435 [Corynebacterium tuberculostearicum]
MDVHDDPMPSLSDLVQCVREQVSGYGLDDVLGELPTVGLKLPHLRPIVMSSWMMLVPPNLFSTSLGLS